MDNSINNGQIFIFENGKVSEKGKTNVNDIHTRSCMCDEKEAIYLVTIEVLNLNKNKFHPQKGTVSKKDLYNRI